MNIDEREWQAQERAMQDARAGLDSNDPMAARYRKVADALRTPLPDALPMDFAAQVAKLAESNARAPLLVQQAQNGVMESRMLRASLWALGLGSAIVVAMYGREWLAPTLDLLHLESAVAMNWALALGACVGMTWATEMLRRRRESTPAA